MKRMTVENISNIRLDLFLQQNKEDKRVVLESGQSSWCDEGSSTKSMILYERKKLIKLTVEELWEKQDIVTYIASVDVAKNETEAVIHIIKVTDEGDIVPIRENKTSEVESIDLNSSLSKEKVSEETKEEKKYKGKKRGRKKKRGPKKGSKRNKGNNPEETQE